MIVSQLQGLFLRFHNRTVADNPGLDFNQIQRLVRFHYQYMVLNDFLPRIIHSSVLKALKGHDGAYDREQTRVLPLENTTRSCRWSSPWRPTGWGIP